MTVLDVFAIVSSVLAFAVGLGVAVATFRNSRVAERDLDALVKADTEAAIASADLNALGFNLVRRLGGTSIRSYVADEAVRAEFDEAFNTIRAYLQTAGSAADPVDVGTGSQERVSASAWSEAASARNDLEAWLRENLPATDRDMSLQQMVGEAREQGVLETNDADELLGAVRVTGAALSGQPLSEGQVGSAVDTIRGRLTKSSPTRRAKPTKPAGAEYHVFPSDGKWVVRAANASRASAHFSNQTDAINRARDIVHNAGGGEVAVHGRDGRIRDKDTVSPKDPNRGDPPKDRA